jgi:hypothetical protein
MAWQNLWVGLGCACVVACGDAAGDDAEESGTGESGTSSGATASVGESSMDDGGSSVGSASADASTEGADDAGDGDEFGESGGVLSPCPNDQLELTNVTLEFTLNRVLGEDIAAEFDAAQGSYACAAVGDDFGQVIAHFGPFAFGEPQSALHLDFFDGVRSYDLATDPGPPGTGETGLLGFGYVYQIESASSLDFSTVNQAGIGTVDVVAHPLDGGTNVDFTAVGTIGSPGSWEFDLHFTAVVTAG